MTSPIKQRFKGFFATEDDPGPKKIVFREVNGGAHSGWLPKTDETAELTIKLVEDQSIGIFHQLAAGSGWESPKMVNIINRMVFIPDASSDEPQLKNIRTDISEEKFDDQGWHIVDWVVRKVEETVKGKTETLICDFITWQDKDGHKVENRYGYIHYK